MGCSAQCCGLCHASSRAVAFPACGTRCQHFNEVPFRTQRLALRSELGKSMQGRRLQHSAPIARQTGASMESVSQPRVVRLEFAVCRVLQRLPRVVKSRTFMEPSLQTKECDGLICRPCLVLAAQRIHGKTLRKSRIMFSPPGPTYCSIQRLKH